MRLRNSEPFRWAFTLVEMLVVIALLLILMTIAAAMFPRFAENQRIIKGGDQVLGMLLNARQRALRDKLSTGVRIEFDGSGPTNRLTLVQRIGDFAVQRIVPTGNTTAKLETWFVGSPGPGQKIALFEAAVTPPGTPVAGPFDFDPSYFTTQADLAPVQHGDFLEVNNGGLVMMIDGVIPPDAQNPFGNRLQLVRPVPENLGQPPLRRPYRIIRQPRPVAGEPPLELPQNIVIEPPPLSRDLPIRQVLLGDPRQPQQRVPKNYVEIMFSPGGGVDGKGTSTGGNIILWVRDASKGGPTEGSPLLVSIHTRTGMIAVHPVNTGGTPAEYYSFTQDGRSSGL